MDPDYLKRLLRQELDHRGLFRVSFNYGYLGESFVFQLVDSAQNGLGAWSDVIPYRVLDRDALFLSETITKQLLEAGYSDREANPSHRPRPEMPDLIQILELFRNFRKEYDPDAMVFMAADRRDYKFKYVKVLDNPELEEDLIRTLCLANLPLGTALWMANLGIEKLKIPLPFVPHYELTVRLFNQGCDRLYEVMDGLIGPQVTH